MAKIKHHNFNDTINDMLVEAKRRGVIQLEFEGDSWKGDTMQINNRELVNFGTCGYLGLENHPKIIEEVIEFTKRYGTQFSVSRSYLVSKQSNLLEEYLSKIFSGRPVISYTSTTMAHSSIIPIVVGNNDAIILDQQVHATIQTATQLMVSKGVPIHIIRHSNMEMLEHKIKALNDKYDKIWYMVDGVYSMYGDIAPMHEINLLMEKYNKLHLYMDDAHGMSWYGQNGAGRLFERTLKNNKTVYVTTMAKGFGTMGGIAVFPDTNWYDKIILYGGVLAHSHPVPPPMLGAALGSAKIHLSPEIYTLQDELQDKIQYANSLFDQTNIPIISNPNTPIYFIGTGQPSVGYNLNKRILDEGYYVNIGMFPAVPIKNTGLRFTITNHVSKKQIKSFIETINYHYPKALEAEGKNLNNVRRAFRLPLQENKIIEKKLTNEFEIITSNTIEDIDQKTWDKAYLGKGNFDWRALLLLEKSFANNEMVEENWKFHYILVFNKNKDLVLATFLTSGLFKDDLLSEAEISKTIEREREQDKYYLCSKTLIMGSLFTEGEHLFLDKSDKNWKKAVGIMLKHTFDIQESEKANGIMLRDFTSEEEELSDIFHTAGFFKIGMPNTNIIKQLPNNKDSFYENLSKRNRKNFRNEVVKYQDLFKVEIKKQLTEEEENLAYQLYLQLSEANFAINTFNYPKNLLKFINKDPNWEFVCLYMDNKLVAVVCCYFTENIYCPIFMGMDIQTNSNYKTYKQILYQILCRAIDKNYDRVFMGLSADFEKRKIGATQIDKVAFYRLEDQFNMEIIENISI